MATEFFNTGPSYRVDFRADARPAELRGPYGGNRPYLAENSR
ncbi:hypothetical protein [Nocardia nova]|nr:hypothetical protein [Nocardia nova]